MNRKWLTAGGILLAIIILGVALFQMALSWVADELANSQVAGLKIAEVSAGWNWIELTGVEYTPPGSEKVALSAEVISLSPTFLSLLSDTIQISSVGIEGPYLFLERLPDGSLKLPFPQAAGGGEGSNEGDAPQAVEVGVVRITQGKGEFLDRSVGRPYAHFRLKDVSVTLEDLRYPLAEGAVNFSVSCALEGKTEGRFKAGGWIDPVAQSARMNLEAADLDATHAEPYLREGMTAKITDGRVRSTAEVDMTSGSYVAEGEVDLAGFGLSNSGNFMGIPALMVNSFLKTAGRELILPFKIEGNLNEKAKFQTRLVQAVRANMADLVPNTLRALDTAKEGTSQLKDKVKGIKKLFGQ